MSASTNALFIILAAQMAQKACDEEMKKRKESGNEELTKGDIIAGYIMTIIFILVVIGIIIAL